VGYNQTMHRPLTDAAALRQLKAVGVKLAGKAKGKARLALLRQQAELGDQRDEALEKARRPADKERS
jgi:hypothetical protein